MKISTYSLALLFFTQMLLSQSSNATADAIEKYFELERENIQLSVNKNTFTTGETLYFKGTVIEKKSQLVFPTTTNILVNFIANDGSIINNQLVYANNGIFSGSILIDKKMPSGAYYLQVYTNFMNNFIENEATEYKVQIYNLEQENYFPKKTVDLSSIDINIFPESGVFLNESNNIFAVQVADCNGNIPEITHAKITNEAGLELTTFTINSQGIGKFELFNAQPELYQLTLFINDQKFMKQLPSFNLQGITLSANNYSIANKTFITLKTNKTTLENLKNTKLSLYILSNGKINAIDIKSITDLETKFIIPNDEFFKGVNTLFLVDENNQKLAERHVFYPINPKSATLNVLEKTADNILVQGNSNLKNATISVSILPSASVCIEKQSTAINQLLFANNFETSLINPDYYFSELTTQKKIELDAELMTKTSKYKWQNIISNAPEKKFDFDNGLTLKGTANVELKNMDKSTVRMSALLLGIDQKVSANNKGEFIFSNLFTQDSTIVFFELFDSTGKKQTIRTAAQVLNGKRKFNHERTFAQAICTKSTALTEKIIFPKQENIIDLTTIEIQNKKKNVLINKVPLATGYKITEQMCAQYFDIFAFLRASGYSIIRNMGEIEITATGSTTALGGTPKPPVLFIDGIIQFDLTVLDIINFCDVDEIFINRRGGGGGPDSVNGGISIFLKKPNERIKVPTKYQSQEFMIKNGFKTAGAFANTNYLGTSAPMFNQYGAINWLSDVIIDGDGNFKFSFPSMGKQDVKVIIEGVDSNGDIISTVQDLKL